MARDPGDMAAVMGVVGSLRGQLSSDDVNGNDDELFLLLLLLLLRLLPEVDVDFFFRLFFRFGLRVEGVVEGVDDSRFCSFSRNDSSVSSRPTCITRPRPVGNTVVLSVWVVRVGWSPS